MIELTLEQANRILEYMDPEYPNETAEQFEAVRALMDKVRAESERYAAKPCPRYVVFESNDGKSFIIWDTAERKRYSYDEYTWEWLAQKYADDLNRCPPANN